MFEEWRAVVGFEGKYEVSNLGRVRSVDRVRSYRKRDARGIISRIHRGKMLSPATTASGHQFVVLGRGCGRLVHRLVLEAFVGAAPDGTECCHNDGEPANNRVNNLRWDTRSANIMDDYEHGVRKRAFPRRAA